MRTILRTIPAAAAALAALVVLTAMPANAQSQTVTQLVSATNVAVPAAPPSFFYPNANGTVVSAGATGYQLITDSPAYTQGSTANMAVEIQVGGVWQQFSSVGGYTLGSYVSDDTGQVTTINQFSVFLTGQLPAHSRIRLRVDSIPAGTLASLTINKLS